MGSIKPGRRGIGCAHQSLTRRRGSFSSVGAGAREHQARYLGTAARRLCSHVALGIMKPFGGCGRRASRQGITEHELLTINAVSGGPIRHFPAC
jgi:hypothetical protein